MLFRVTIPPVSIRRADRCLVEAGREVATTFAYAEFQSAVRIAVWLKTRQLMLWVLSTAGFNPPCGSLFG